MLRNLKMLENFKIPINLEGAEDVAKLENHLNLENAGNPSNAEHFEKKLKIL